MDTQIYTFCALAAILTVTPGADTMIVLKNTLRGGRTSGWVTAAGISSGLLVHASASALGLTVVLARSAAAFDIVKTAGAIYLIWLGIRALRENDHAPAADDETGLRTHPGHRSFLEGFLSNVLNPKVAVFYLALLPQFIGPDDPVLAMSLTLASVHIAMGLVWLGVIATAVARSRRLLARPSVKRWMTRISGTVLVGLGLRLAFARR